MAKSNRGRKRNFSIKKDRKLMLGTNVTEQEMVLIENHCDEKQITKTLFLRNCISQVYPNIIIPIQ